MILVIAEQREGRLSRSSWEALAAAQQLASATSQPVGVAVCGARVDDLAAELAVADVAGVWCVNHDGLASYTPETLVAAVTDLLAAVTPSYVCLPHTYQTRDFAPVLAARLDRALITDVIGIGTRDGQPTFMRPMFQGKLVAEVVGEGPLPHLVSCQVGAFRADAVVRGSGAPVTHHVPALDLSQVRQVAEPPFQETKAAVDLSQAERIVAVGRGIKAQEHVALAQQLAAAFGAELAASRPICDNGWLPMERQIGSSGQTVAPKLYVALGISGAIQHLVGMKGARTIVAINKDAEAPMFEVADYGVVGDLFELAPALIAALGND